MRGSLKRVVLACLLGVAALSPSSCAKWQALEPADTAQLVVPADLSALATLRLEPHHGHEYLLQKSVINRETTWLYGATMRTAEGRTVRYSAGFTVCRTAERAKTFMSATALLEKGQAPEERLPGLAVAYGVDQAFGSQRPKGLEVWLLKGRLYYHLSVEGARVPESQVREVLPAKFTACETRFLGP